MIQFEKEVCDFLSIPKIPIKEWDEESGFDQGVAVVRLMSGAVAYAACTYDPDREENPRITKVFSPEPFGNLEAIYVVPAYMDTDMSDADLDDESKKKAAEIVQEVKVLEGNNEDEIKMPEHEYIFEHITNDEEAVAFIKSYNASNKIKGRIPSSHEGIVMRLSVIYAEQQKHNK